MRSAPFPLDADLDAIIAKALRKEPQERYGSVVELGADVLRFLQSRPVVARRGTAIYRASRWVRRYRWALATSVAVVISVINDEPSWSRSIYAVSMAFLGETRLEDSPGGPLLSRPRLALAVALRSPTIFSS